jgi:hypothetical protein
MITRLLKNAFRYLFKWAMDDEFKKISKELTRLSLESSARDERVDRIANSIVVGMDVHEHPADSSWAVICVRGKGGQDAVRFIQLHSDVKIRELTSFLKRFETDPYIDATPHTTGYLKTVLRWRED